MLAMLIALALQTPPSIVPASPASTVTEDASADADVFVPPQWAEQPTIDYPRQAFEAGVDGDVTIECLAGIDGLAKHCAIISEEPAGYGFGDIVMAAVPHFRLLPATLNGVPDERRISSHIPFRIEQTTKPDPTIQALMSGIGAAGYYAGFCPTRVSLAESMKWDEVATSILEHPDAPHRFYDRVFAAGYIKGKTERVEDESLCDAVRTWANGFKAEMERAIIKMDLITPPEHRGVYRPAPL